MADLTLISIASNGYQAYLNLLIASLNGVNCEGLSIQWIILTDDSGEIQVSKLSNVATSFVEIPSETWPLPTLRRYEFIAGIGELIEGHTVMYIDADMLFTESLSLNSLTSLALDHKLVLVEHPGYFRGDSISAMRLYLQSPKRMVGDFLRMFQFGGIGSWETNPASTAYVPRAKRRKYVCGGVWLGLSDEVLSMCEKLQENVSRDLNSGIIARFHDESHLNWYYSFMDSFTLSPEYCHEGKYDQLKGLTARIIAVDKGAIVRG